MLAKIPHKDLLARFYRSRELSRQKIGIFSFWEESCSEKCLITGETKQRVSDVLTGVCGRKCIHAARKIITRARRS
jgi:hypothetical protein